MIKALYTSTKSSRSSAGTSSIFGHFDFSRWSEESRYSLLRLWEPLSVGWYNWLIDTFGWYKANVLRKMFGDPFLDFPPFAFAFS